MMNCRIPNTVVIPQTLDQVIREHRDTMSLGLATANERAAICKSIVVPDGQEIKAEIIDWRLVAYRAALPVQHVYAVMMHVLGNIYTGDRRPHPWITSHLVALDLGNRVVVTHTGSFYRLIGKPGEGEPNQIQLLQLCRAFHQWGRGARLGIPTL